MLDDLALWTKRKFQLFEEITGANPGMKKFFLLTNVTLNTQQLNVEVTHCSKIQRFSRKQCRHQQKCRDIGTNKIFSDIKSAFLPNPEPPAQF